jgi:hypothetical protein
MLEDEGGGAVGRRPLVLGNRVLALRSGRHHGNPNLGVERSAVGSTERVFPIAVIKTRPGAQPCTTPTSEMVATELSLLRQVVS